jgi:hypothetical protein
MTASIEPAPIIGGGGGRRLRRQDIVGRERALRGRERNPDNSRHDELFHLNPTPNAKPIFKIHCDNQIFAAGFSQVS